MNSCSSVTSARSSETFHSTFVGVVVAKAIETGSSPFSSAAFFAARMTAIVSSLVNPCMSTTGASIASSSSGRKPFGVCTLDASWIMNDLP